MVFLGFRLGWHTGRVRPRQDALPLFHGDALMRWLFIVYLMTFPISYAYRLEFAPFDIAGMVGRLMAGVQDPHYGYAATQEKTGGPIPWMVYFVISIFNQLFFAAGFLSWSRLTRRAKALFVTLVGIDLFYWVGIATSFGAVSLATTFGLSTMFWKPRMTRWRIGKSARRFVLLASLLAGTIAFFSHNLYRRSNFAEIDVRQYEVAQSPILLDHPAFTVIPQSLWPTYIMVVSYLGQGYYHTCSAFDLEFRPTAFLGNNPAAIGLGRMVGIDVWPDTYMHRLQPRGIDELGVWHSAYTWFASDVSFYGVPVLLAIVGYLFGFSWGQGLQGDFLSRLVFLMFGNVLLFLFANNTYLSSVFYAFMVFVPLWLVTRLVGVAFDLNAARRPAQAAAPIDPMPRHEL
jgi:hypothetical protein